MQARYLPSTNIDDLFHCYYYLLASEFRAESEVVAVDIASEAVVEVLAAPAIAKTRVSWNR